MAKETLKVGLMHQVVIDHDVKLMWLECTGTPAERGAMPLRERAIVLAEFRRHIQRLVKQGYWLAL
jgi:hypothetical protein